MLPSKKKSWCKYVQTSAVAGRGGRAGAPIVSAPIVRQLFLLQSKLNLPSSYVARGDSRESPIGIRQLCGSALRGQRPSIDAVCPCSSAAAQQSRCG